MQKNWTEGEIKKEKAENKIIHLDETTSITILNLMV